MCSNLSLFLIVLLVLLLLFLFSIVLSHSRKIDIIGWRRPRSLSPAPPCLPSKRIPPQPEKSLWREPKTFTTRPGAATGVCRKGPGSTRTRQGRATRTHAVHNWTCYVDFVCESVANARIHLPVCLTGFYGKVTT